MKVNGLEHLDLGSEDAGHRAPLVLNRWCT